MKAFLRSALALMTGLFVITMIVEPLEFAIVTIVLGERTTDPATYFGARNLPWFLALKLVYNTGAAVVGGYLAAWIGRTRLMAHGAVLATLQSAALVYAIFAPDIGPWAPLWMWLALIGLSAAGILYGAQLRGRHEGKQVGS